MSGFRNRIQSWSKGLGTVLSDSIGDESSEKTSRSIQHNHYEEDDALPPVHLIGYSEKTKNRLLSKEMCEELRHLMPTRIQLYTEWTLLYSLEQHGASLHSLYDKLKYDTNNNARVGYVIVIRDRKGGIFGGYANETFHPTDSRRYYGNGECFLWKMEKVPDLQLHDKHDCKQDSHNWQLRGFPYTGENEFSIYCTSTFLSMGAGDGHYGLWIDDGLFRGVTSPSMTFGNDILSREGSKFHIVGVEVWRVG
ncbi:Oxr1 [Kluyveromyces lactis]|nr:Oxr1 [Kluyveromyces lactis]